MNKCYLIVPCVLLGVFLLFERDFQRDRKTAESIRLAQAAIAKADDEARIARLRQQTADATRARHEAREKEERDRAEKKRREVETALKTIEDEAAFQRAEADKLARENETIEQRLTELRTRKQAAANEAFDLARQVEQHRIDRRSADIEIQRTTKMVAVRLLESPWASLPVIQPVTPSATSGR